jgi:hypothetical protein
VCGTFICNSFFPSPLFAIILFSHNFKERLKVSTCWHVYRQSVLVIDGRKNNDDGMFTGKNNSEDGTCKNNKDHGKHENHKLGRNSA